MGRKVKVSKLDVLGFFLFILRLFCSLRTNCLREFRYYKNENSIDWFDCNQNTKYPTFLSFCEGLKLITDCF